MHGRLLVQDQAPYKVAEGDDQLPLTAADQEPASAEDAHPRSFERAAAQEHRDEAQALRSLVSEEVRPLPKSSLTRSMLVSVRLCAGALSVTKLPSLWHGLSIRFAECALDDVVSAAGKAPCLMDLHKAGTAMQPCVHYARQSQSGRSCHQPAAVITCPAQTSIMHASLKHRACQLSAHHTLAAQSLWLTHVWALQEEEPQVDTSRMAATQAFRPPQQLALKLVDDQPEPGTGADSKERGILVRLSFNALTALFMSICQPGFHPMLLFQYPA